MNTQTHLLISAFALAKPGHRLRNGALVFGALLPDASIFALVLWSKIQQIPERQVWRELYWQEPWQTFGALFNSIPLYGVGLLISGSLLFRLVRHQDGLIRPHRHQAVISALVVLFLSALLHIAFDFPVHVDDAHRHFWPISDWRFKSSISYWNGQYHGDTVQSVEAIAGLLMAVALWFRFEQLWVRAMLIVAALSYGAVPLYWATQLGG